MQFLHDYTVDFTCIKTLTCMAGNLIKSPGQCHSSFTPFVDADGEKCTVYMYMWPINNHHNRWLVQMCEDL